MEPNQIDLSELKDIHPMIQPDFWPLAEGWYILCALLILIILIGFYIYHKYRNSPVVYAIKELEKIKKAPKEKQFKLLSQLLKRVAMVKYPRNEVAPLIEEKWQEFILAAAPDIFSEQQAKSLAYAIYNPKNKVPDQKLFQLTRQWIKKVLK